MNAGGVGPDGGWKKKKRRSLVWLPSPVAGGGVPCLGAVWFEAAGPVVVVRVRGVVVVVAVPVAAGFPLAVPVGAVVVLPPAPPVAGTVTTGPVAGAFTAIAGA